MNKPKPPIKGRLLRLFLWLAGIAVAFVVYGDLFGPQTAAYGAAHWIAWKDPTVNIVPQPLNYGSASESPGTTLSYFGNSFEAPWKGLVEQKQSANIKVVAFASGQALMIWAPMGKTGELEGITADKEIGSPAMRNLFADELKSTPYQQTWIILNATTSQVKFLDPARVSSRTLELLLFKEMGEIESETGMYSFQTSTARGFQLGNPASTWRTRLDFFDSAGNSLGEISCWLGKTPSARGTQAEINRIIQTFHPVTSASNNSPSPAILPASARK